MKIHIRYPGGAPVLDMTPDGQFRSMPGPLSSRIFRAAVIVAVLAGAFAIAALAFWFAMILIPVAIVAGLIGWAAFRFRLWRSGISFRR